MTRQKEGEGEDGWSVSELTPSTLLERARAELRVKDAELEKKGADLEVAAKSGLTLVRENKDLKFRVERLNESLRRRLWQAPRLKLSRPLPDQDIHEVGGDADVGNISDASEGSADESAGTDACTPTVVGSPDSAPLCATTGTEPAVDRCVPLEFARRAYGSTPRSHALSGRRTWMSPARFADHDFIHSLELEHTELQYQFETVVSESDRAQRLARHTQKRLETMLEKTRADLDAALREKSELERDNRLLARQRVDIAAYQHGTPKPSAGIGTQSAGEETASGADPNDLQCTDHSWWENQPLERLAERVAELELSAQSLKSAKTDAEGRLREVLVDLEEARQRVEELVVLEAEIPALRNAYEMQQDDIRELWEELNVERARNADLGRRDTNSAMAFWDLGTVDLREPSTPQPGLRANVGTHVDDISESAASPAGQPCAPDTGMATPTARLRKATYRTLQAEFESVCKGDELLADKRMERKFTKEAADLVPGAPKFLFERAEGVRTVFFPEFGDDLPSSAGHSVYRMSGPVGFVYGCLCGMIRYAKFLAILFFTIVYALWAGPRCAGL